MSKEERTGERERENRRGRKRLQVSSEERIGE